MSLTNYTTGTPVGLNGSGASVTFHLAELSNGNLAVVRQSGLQILVETYAVGNNSPLNSVLMQAGDNSGNLGYASEEYDVMVGTTLLPIPGQERFLVVVPDESGGTHRTTFNVWNYDLTLHQTFNLPSQAVWNSSLDMDAQGNFVYCAQVEVDEDPQLYYYSAGSTVPTWSTAVPNSTGDIYYQYVQAKFLSNGNIVVASSTHVGEGSADGDGRIKYSIWNPNTESQVVAPTYHPHTGVMHREIHASMTVYDDNFMIFWVVTSNTRLLARFQNDGTLLTQTDYEVEDLGSQDVQEIVRSITLPHTSGFRLATTYWYLDGGNRYLRLILHDPEDLNGDGQMAETSYTSGVMASLQSPQVFADSEGNLYLMYWSSGTLYQQPFTYVSPLPERTRDWHWSWKRSARRGNLRRNIPSARIFPWNTLWGNRRN